MARILPSILLVLTGAAAAAPPLVTGIMPPLHERPSDGRAITGPASRDGTDETMNVCMIRVQFLEDFTELTSGNGRMDLDADPPHDRVYFRTIADDVSSYYEDVSGGELVLEIDIYPSELDGCYTADHQMMHYGDDAYYVEGSCLLLHDAVLLADQDIDFSQYDAVIVIHAGSGQEADIYRNSPGDIGSIFLTLSDLTYYLPGAGQGYRGIPTNDGVYVAEGMIVPEQESQDGFGLGVLGTIVHEFGHQLGLPDLYDTYTGNVGVGGWDLMGYGQWMMSGYWPSAPGAWCRIFLGWDSPKEVDSGTFTLAPDDSILMVPLNGTEYLLIENRQRDPDGDGMCGVDEHDFGLAGSGVLIWHIDQTRLGDYVGANIVNVDPDHKGVDLEEADGIQDFDYSLPDIYGYEGSEFDPWFPSGYAWEFSPSSEPSSDASWGGRTFVTVEVLDDPGNQMDVKVTRSTVCQGWPVHAGPLGYGPVLWEDADGMDDRLVVTTSTGIALAYGIDGEGPQSMGLGITAPPVAGSLSGGDQLLLVCGNDGRVHLRDLEWNEPGGWPVTLPGGVMGVQALISSGLGIVAVADNDQRIHMFDESGEKVNGWPVQVQAPVTGLAVYPDGERPGLAATTSDGRVHLWRLDGRKAEGWPAAPGEENISIPMAADIDRDGDIDLVAASGECIYAFDGSGELLPGFPAMLPSPPLSSPCLADPDDDGRLETVILTWDGIAAVGASGATLEDWPAHLEQDSLVASYSSGRSGVGGSGFAMVTMDDGRVCLFDGTGGQSGIFPVSVGDRPVGRPVIWDPQGTGEWRAAAAGSNGTVYCWNTGFQPQGWFTGRDQSGSNCWWSQDLPPLQTSGSVLEQGSFYVYPNPVRTGSGVIRFRPGHDCTWEIRVFNMGGDLVTMMSGSAPGGSAWEETWDTEDLAPGVYFVSLGISSPEGSTEAIFHAAVIN
ncbi:MAG: M6 family metalloprotease domain-containing protein [Candidatus Fermentibacteraceae bacterium]|nr:M6 family metalloprotease domain-containing protein [Candidatus Fermentibacteraceae bacterium]